MNAVRQVLTASVASLGLVAGAHAGDRWDISIGVSSGERCPPVVVEPAWQIVQERVWIEPEFRTVIERVWFEPVIAEREERVWVPEVVEQRIVRSTDDCGRIISRVETRVIQPGFWTTEIRKIIVREGHWVETPRQELVCEGRWEIRERRVLVREAHVVRSTGNSIDLGFRYSSRGGHHRPNRGDSHDLGRGPRHDDRSDIDFRRDDLNFQRDDIDFQRDDINFERDDINFTRNDVNFMRDDINFDRAARPNRDFRDRRSDQEVIDRGERYRG
jgi:hypothetical protein